MREYQRKRNNPYHLPHNLYMRVLYTIRDYDRLRAEMTDIMFASPERDGQPSGTAMHSSTESKAIRIAQLEGECRAVEQALNQIPMEYQRGVMRNVCYGLSYPQDADYFTYSRWRQRFIYHTAHEMHLI